ncbi:hypothetical protein LLG96_04275, partial [bacterium]|nr:hypothetical protein [bacterium]
NIADRARRLTHADIEHEFWHNGYNDFITKMVPKQRHNEINTEASGNTIKKTKLLIKAAIKKAGGKPAFAQLLATEIQQRSISTIPQTVQDIITRVVQLAGG